MSRTVWLLAGVALVGSNASEAYACTSTYRVVPPIEGESHEDMLARSRALEQSEYAAQADVVYLAEVTQTRLVEDRQTEATFSPLHVFSGSDLPEWALTLRRGSCVLPVLGEYYVVYASRSSGDWSILAFLTPDRVVDPNVRPRLRDALRGVRRGEPGELPPPVYPD